LEALCGLIKLVAFWALGFWLEAIASLHPNAAFIIEGENICLVAGESVHEASGGFNINL